MPIFSPMRAGQRTVSAREALARRAALARQPRPEGVSGPPLRLLLGELRTFAGLIRRDAVPHQAHQPQPVMLLPGFGAHPMRMRRMQIALEAAGHSAYDWGLGFNLGPTPANFAFLLARADKLARRHGAPVALVGWSLGGLFAREIGNRMPDRVSRVITMGTPFSGNPRANNAWRAYELITGHSVDTPPVECDFRVKPPVPTIALWSPRDGIVAPRNGGGE